MRRDSRFSTDQAKGMVIQLAAHSVSSLVTLGRKMKEVSKGVPGGD